MSPHWDEAALAPLKAQTDATVSGVPVKKRFGSDYPYREVLEHLGVQADQVTTFASFAKGRLSNIWGAAVLPYRAEDMTDWPITARELEPYYQAVFDFLPLAAARDDLAEMFPLYSETSKPLTPSWQAKRLLEHLNKCQPPSAVEQQVAIILSALLLPMIVFFFIGVYSSIRELEPSNLLLLAWLILSIFSLLYVHHRYSTSGCANFWYILPAVIPFFLYLTGIDFFIERKFRIIGILGYILAFLFILASCFFFIILLAT